MLGLMYLGTAGLYLAFMVFAVRKAWRFARTRGSSTAVALALALVTFLAIYNLAFWNLIPTIVVHRQACARDAGFKAFAPPEEWATQHAEIVESWRGRHLTLIGRSVKTDDGFSRDFDLGGARAWDRRSSKIRSWGGIELIRIEQRIVDPESNLILAAAVDYQTGSRDHIAIWLNRPSCFPEGRAPVHSMNEFAYEMEGRR